MHDHITFDSQRGCVSSSSYLSCQSIDGGYMQFNIASGYVSTTEILFQHEGILLTVTASGELAFYNRDKKLLAAASVPADSGGRQRHLNICCKVDGDRIFVTFPVYTWYDNYPNCDGESDRWDYRITGYQNPVVFSIAASTIISATE